MTIKIQRGRQFAAADATVALFDDKGKAGSYLSKASEKLVAQNMTIVLRDGHKKVTLASADDWKAFLDAHCSNKDVSGADFTKHFGITFGDFVNAIDDAAASDDTGLKLDLRPTSQLGKALSLDKVDGDYAAKLAKDATLSLTGDGGVTGTAQAVGVPTIGKDILANPVGSDWERDRTEMEAWADFKNKGDAADLFKDHTGPAAYGKLYQPKWDDPEAMALVNAFTLPLHLEVKGTNPDGTTKFQDGYEMFRDTYFDDRNGSLDKAGASVRARVRFDNNEPFTVNRVLVQAKEGREVTGTDSAVHKFEKRWEGNFTDENAAKDMLVNGKEKNGSTLVVAQKLYKLASDRGTLPADGNLQLTEKYTVLQKRRRTHLQLDGVSEVQSRRTALQGEMDKLKAANQPIPPAMQAFADKLDAQVKFLTDASTMLRKYGQYMPSGECFIVSSDRYNVYDMSARKGVPPNDIGDDLGRIGKGPLHVEAEWDTNASDPFEKAVDKLDEQLKTVTDPAQKDVLTADRAALEDMRATFRKDVAATVEVTRQALLKAGLKEDTEKKSKEEHASDIANDKDRPTFWV